MKHLNPRQGITIHHFCHISHHIIRILCETPKSPPGDYNKRWPRDLTIWRACWSVKHLNPRQGITMGQQRSQSMGCLVRGVKHLNPRQGITIDNRVGFRTHFETRTCETPKSPPGDYNGVKVGVCADAEKFPRVKHLNPRQGITISASASVNRTAPSSCETPKSPPGDYNFSYHHTIII